MITAQIFKTKKCQKTIFLKKIKKLIIHIST